MKYDAIVLAGGKGNRLNLGYNKVFYQMNNGKTILENAYHLFLEDDDCQRLIIAISNEDKARLKLEDKMIVVSNGKERYLSVINALKEVKSEYVMIHDGARPYLVKDDLEALKECLKYEDACVLARKEKDTIKEVMDGYIIKTIDRDKLYHAQTPQCFKSELIKQANRNILKNDDNFTDDASIVECCKPDIKVRIVEAKYNNEKITYLSDLDIKT